MSVTPQDFVLRPMILSPADQMMKSMLPDSLPVEQAIKVVRGLLSGKLKVLTVSKLKGKTAKVWVEVQCENHAGQYTVAFCCMGGTICQLWAVLCPSRAHYDVNLGGNASLLLTVEEWRALTERFAPEMPKAVEEKKLSKLVFNSKGQIVNRPKKHSVN